MHKVAQVPVDKFTIFELLTSSNIHYLIPLAKTKHICLIIRQGFCNLFHTNTYQINVLDENILIDFPSEYIIFFVLFIASYCSVNRFMKIE